MQQQRVGCLNTMYTRALDKETLLLTVEDAALVTKAKLPSGQLLEVVAGLPGQKGSIRS